MAAMMAQSLLEQCACNQFGCYWLFSIQLAEGVTPRAELKLRYQSALPSMDDGHIDSVLAMTAAVVRARVPQFMAQPWPIRYVAELPVEHMRDNKLVDGLLQVIYLSNAQRPVTVEDVHSLHASLFAGYKRGQEATARRAASGNGR